MKPKNLKQLIEEAQNLLLEDLDKLNPLLREVILDSIITGTTPYNNLKIKTMPALNITEIAAYQLAKILHKVKHERKGYYIHYGINKPISRLAKGELQNYMEQFKYRKRHP